MAGGSKEDPERVVYLTFANAQHLAKVVLRRARPSGSHSMLRAFRSVIGKRLLLDSVPPSNRDSECSLRGRTFKKLNTSVVPALVQKWFRIAYESPMGHPKLRRIPLE